MKKDARHTLLMPITSDMVRPVSGEILYLNALVTDVDDALKSLLVCEQGMRGDHLALNSAGFSVVPSISAETRRFDGCLVLLGKHKERNHINIERALAFAKPGSPILVCGEKTAGISPMLKAIKKRFEIEGQISKNHAVVFWFKSPADASSGNTSLALSTIEGTDYRTAPGMFSHGKIDPGSALLARFIDNRLNGAVADFGAGWGYLSERSLALNPKIDRLDLYEADHDALEAARMNIARSLDGRRMDAFWHDLVAEPVERKYNWIIMNPPFHSGRHSRVSLGQGFIKTARHSLQRGGRLLMVANRHLPYEQIVNETFGKFDVLADEAGFKVIEARA